MRVDWCGCGSCEQVARVGMMLSARNCVADALQRCRGRTSLVCVRENLLYIASVTDFFLADTRRWMEAVLLLGGYDVHISKDHDYPLSRDRLFTRPSLIDVGPEIGRRAGCSNSCTFIAVLLGRVVAPVIASRWRCLIVTCQPREFGRRCPLIAIRSPCTCGALRGRSSC